MSSVTIGITATELFTYNPFRILGIAVNTPQAEIEYTYKQLLALAESGDIGNHVTPFDFDSLPPFSRSAQTIKTAYAKLASVGYRCFAYADSSFSVSLNVDDIALNLRDITCYDCFLRCYMWLIINDREMQWHDLWIQLAAYIDKLIASTPDQWSKYFDDRYPAGMIDEKMITYKTFYKTFCEIILLPIKELVKGSMKCHTATDILKVAKIDVNEEFEYIDIPQANLPKPGEPAPKLKLAEKEPEEYYDIATGTMRSAVESNQFEGTTAAPLSAEDVIVEEPEPAEEIVDTAEAVESDTEQPQEANEQTAAAQQPAENVYEPEPARPAPTPAPAPSPAPMTRMTRRGAQHTDDAASAHPTHAVTPTEPVIEKPEPLEINHNAPTPSVQGVPEPAEEVQTAAPKRTVRSTRRTLNTAGAPTQSATTAANKPSGTNPFASTSTNPFAGGAAAKSDTPSAPKAEEQGKRSTRDFTKIVEQAAADAAAAEAAAAELAVEDEDDENYTEALIQMLRSNQLRSETMQSVDVSHMKSFSDKEMSTATGKAPSMDDVDVRKYDASQLSSGKETAVKKLTREQRYRNVKIDDMLGTNTPKNYGTSAIEEYKKAKAKEKANRKAILTTLGVVAICLAMFIILFFAGII